MVAATRSLSSASPSQPGAAACALEWCRRRPLAVLLLAASLGVLVYFFGFFKIFVNGTKSAAMWSSEAWNSENNQEHSWLVLPISLALIWYHSAKIRAMRTQPWNAGLAIVAFGVACFVVSARALQPRIAIFSLPLIVLGSVAFLWGRKAARVVLFPCAFMLFMTPIGGFVQGTVSLQLLVSTCVQALSSLIGLKIEMIGTTLKATDGSFDFEIAEGCSGIRSLMAMTMLTALFVHFTQNEWWKKGVIFVSSLVFAVIGNIGRIFSVILVAKFISAEFASKIYHDYSAFIFFPIAVLAMAAFAHALNLDWPAMLAEHLEPHPPDAPPREPGAEAGATKPANPVSYDY
ncbi:MAG TPA: exosortase/archaeosortase family protein [Chthoniobacteraceae bacterium]|nr:exosortase/archaeosortase family protein [Chthoniobacteraceae bacterium]